MLEAAKDEQSLELHLQGLGVTGTTLQHPHFAKDNIPTIQLARYTVAADCFDGKEAAGPVPKFLTSNPIEVAKQLKENPALAHGYCQALAGKLIVPEDLTSLEAMAYVQGSMRVGKGESPFLREWRPPQPPQKRHKPSPGTNISGPLGDSQGIINFV
jgi:hypothetical protein